MSPKRGFAACETLSRVSDRKRIARCFTRLDRSSPPPHRVSGATASPITDAQPNASASGSPLSQTHPRKSLTCLAHAPFAAQPCPTWPCAVPSRSAESATVTVAMRRKPVDSKTNQPRPSSNKTASRQRVHGASAPFGGATPRRPRPHRVQSRPMPAPFGSARSRPHSAKIHRKMVSSKMAITAI